MTIAKRGRLEIMKDILRIIQENRNSIKMTPLMRNANLSSMRFREYFEELLKKELIFETITKNDEKYISLTEKGFKFLEKYITIINFIEEFEL
jgi:predicted transcriptional regulator